MTRQVSILTTTSLSVALEQIVRAPSEDACAAALVSAASLLQTAVMNGQSGETIFEAIENCPRNLGKPLAAAMTRAVEFQLLEEGETLGLWLIPVVLNTKAQLPGVLPLAGGLDQLKLAGILQEQLALKAAPGEAGGWNYVIPALYSEDKLRDAELPDLVRLPMHARQLVRGERQSLNFLAGGDLTASAPGVSMYFLPVVACYRANAAVGVPQASERMMHRLSRWVRTTLESHTDLLIQVSPRPQPFATALQVGDRMLLAARVTGMMHEISERTGVAFNGMSALVAPYAVRAHENLVLGISLVSRLTNAPIATLTLPIDGDDGEQEVALVTCVLQDLGTEQVQRQADPIHTLTCQHCGGMQYAMPSHDRSCAGIVDGGHQTH